MKTLEEYLREHAVLDANCDQCGSLIRYMDGEFVPLSIAMQGARKAELGELESKPPTWYKGEHPLWKKKPLKQDPLIWGEGWYAIWLPKECVDEEEIDDSGYWCTAPKKFFEEKGYCPTGFEYLNIDHSAEEWEDLLLRSYEPEVPEEFDYISESSFECNQNISMEEQKEILKNNGFLVDNIPKWYYER